MMTGVDAGNPVSAVPNGRGVMRLAPWLVLGLTVAVFAVTVALVTLQLRKTIRGQILRHNADLLHAVAMMHGREAVEEVGSVEASDPIGLFPVLLKTSRLKGVVAARLFDAQGSFLAAFPIEVADSPPEPAVEEVAVAARPMARLHARAQLADYLIEMPDAPGEPHHPLPLLEVLIPLQTSTGAPVVGVGQFIIEGFTVAEQFAALDRHLAFQAGLAFLAGALVMVLGLGWMFRRLQRANLELARRTHLLLQANQELATSARTNALGAVTAHLIHGLRNPLSGLQQFITGHANGSGNAQQEDWQAAAATTRRLQGLVNEAVNVLREEQGEVRYEVSIEEMASLVASRVQPLAGQAGVDLDIRTEARGSLDNRSVNLVVLILSNLLQNAIQATPAGKRVHLELLSRTGDIECRVTDEGPGIPVEHQERLFTPQSSSKEGGSGIGLAISRQLALHLGANLELCQSSPRGSVFALRLPGRLLVAATGDQSSATAQVAQTA